MAHRVHAADRSPICARERLETILKHLPDERAAFGPWELRAAPFLNLQDVLEWEPELRPQDKHCRSSIPSQKSCRILNPLLTTESTSTDLSAANSLAEEKRERFLVSHDYGGGHWEDHYYQGFRGTDTYYHIYDFDVIDIFNFFTHDRLSVPPPGWTHLAHKHGTQVLGTFLVEGKEEDEGFEDCLRILMNDDVRERLIKQLVKICTFFGFEGYLLNFEIDLSNRTDVSHLMSNLRTFVENVTAHVHATVPNGRVLWYDAIAFKYEDRAKEGELKWQDYLNEANAAFFHHSDGMLTNYYWHPDTLETDVQNASSRHIDVFKGIDVFARGIPCYSAGLGCLPAIEQIQKFQLSCGLFAPVYFHEKCPPEKSPVLYSAEFWSGVKKVWKWIRLPAQLPFVTHFSLGHGHRFFMEGSVVSTDAWFDLSWQDVMPLHTYGRAEDGFNGGESLLLRDSQCCANSPTHFPLYKTHFQLCNYPQVMVSLVYSSESSVGLSFELKHEHYTNKDLKINITSNKILLLPEKADSESSSIECVESVIEENATEFSSTADVEFYPTEKRSWTRLRAILCTTGGIRDYNIVSISIIGNPASGTPFEARIGQLLISPLPSIPITHPTEFTATDVLIHLEHGSGVLSVIEDGHARREVDCQLIWTTTASRTAVFVQTTSSDTSIRPNIFLGWTTSQHGYWIKNLKLKSDVSGLTFRLSVLDAQGKWTALSDAPACHVAIQV